MLASDPGAVMPVTRRELHECNRDQAECSQRKRRKQPNPLVSLSRRFRGWAWVRGPLESDENKRGVPFLVAMLNRYSMNSRWTFRQTAPQNTTIRAGRFFVSERLGPGDKWRDCIMGGDLRRTRETASEVVDFHRSAGWYCVRIGFNFAGYKYLVFSPDSRTARTGFCSDALSERIDRFASPIDR